MALDIQNIITALQKELISILNYWTNNSYDNQFGGFLGERDFYNQLVPQTEKGAVLNARILWTFSAAYNFTEDEKYLQTAHRAYRYLIDFFWDQENGGLFWALNHEGEVVSSRKQTYAQGFGIYGFSEYYQATQNSEALKYAIDLFKLIEKHCYDSKYGGYIEALAHDWSPLADMRLSEKDANEPKSMNTHLHILEPYTNLFRVWKNNDLEKKIMGLINVFAEFIINPHTHHFELFFDNDWTVKSAITSYGHDIEGAWLLAEAAYEIDNELLIKAIENKCIKMVNTTIKKGMADDGSIYNEKEGDNLDDDKHWWPQAEAMVGLTFAWKITGEKKYLEKMYKTWKFIQNNIIDHKNGEWFWRVNAKGNPNKTDVKLGFWKCPYHNTRALIEVIKLLKS